MEVRAAMPGPEPPQIEPAKPGELIVGSNWFPAHQRAIVLTFDSPEQAEAWDRVAQAFVNSIAHAFWSRAKLMPDGTVVFDPESAEVE